MVVALLVVVVMMMFGVGAVGVFSAGKATNGGTGRIWTCAVCRKSKADGSILAKGYHAPESKEWKQCEESEGEVVVNSEEEDALPMDVRDAVT